MKKKILIVVFIIILIALGVIGYFVISDMQQEEKLKTELSEINQLANEETIDMSEIDRKLETIVTKGDYAIVEQAFKQYLRENFDNSIQIAEILNDEKITNLLTVANYQIDGKDFVESKNYIINTREELEKCKSKYIEFFTEEKAMSYIDNKELDSYYVDLYRQEFIGDKEQELSEDIVVNSIDEIVDILNISEEVLNFLSENKNNWEIEDENIVFNNENLSDEYNRLINLL